jgi:hypothetical protein
MAPGGGARVAARLGFVFQIQRATAWALRCNREAGRELCRLAANVHHLAVAFAQELSAIMAAPILSELGPPAFARSAVAPGWASLVLVIIVHSSRSFSGMASQDAGGHSEQRHALFRDEIFGVD